MALLVLLAGGFGYRALAERLGGPSGAAVLARGTLNRLPTVIGPWVGQDLPLDEATIQAADVDDFVNRIYTRQDAAGAVALYIAYGVHFRDLLPHRPEVCYPAAGWARLEAVGEELRTVDGSVVPLRRYRFGRGGLDAGQVTVLNYYDISGQRSADVSALRARLWRSPTPVHYVAQVQVSTTTAAADQTQAEQWGRAFLEEAAPLIAATLTTAVQDALRERP